MSKRDEIVRHFKELILAGKLRIGDRIPSEYTLAEQFGVNKKTANIATNTLVAQGYLERGGRGAGTRVIRNCLYPRGVVTYLGIISGRYNFWARMVKGAQEALDHHGYALHYVRADPRDLNALWQKLTCFGVKGLLTSSYLLIRDSLPFPVVHLDHLPPPDTGYHYVVNDNFKGGYLITRELTDNNHDDIVYIFKDYGDRTMEERRRGFAKAMEEIGRGGEDRIFPLTSSLQNCFLDNILKSFPGATGIVCETDHLAIETLRLLESSGISVPGDISVVGFAALTKGLPVRQITSVEQYPEEMGFQAGNSLVELIEKERDETIRHEIPISIFRGDTVRTQ